MKIEVNLKKKYFFSIVAVFILVMAAIGVYAVWDNAKSFWHSADDVRVTISGTNYSLQEAISAGLIGGGSSPSTPITTVGIDGITFTYYCYDNYGLGPVCTNAGGTQGYCPTGFNQKLALGNFGVCFATDNSHMDIFMSPGGTCNGLGGAVGGRAFVCSNQSTGGAMSVPSGTLCGLTIVGDIGAVVNYIPCQGSYPSATGCPSGYSYGGWGRVTWDEDYAHGLTRAVVTGARLMYCIKN